MLLFLVSFSSADELVDNNNNNTSIRKAHNVSIRAESEAPKTTYTYNDRNLHSLYNLFILFIQLFNKYYANNTL